jgi:DNA-binding response OmpR family regulator
VERLFNIFIIAGEGGTGEQLNLELSQKGCACSIASSDEEVTVRIAEQAPDVVLVESKSHSQIQELARRIKQERNLPIIALVEREMLATVDGHLDLIDDFVVKPYDLMELCLRVERLVRKTRGAGSGEILTCGDLVIDLAKYEVSVGGRPVILTFKEYELLKFLVSNAGRVYTREALLNKVWGYDYYGGDRTVDVHITRLRSKIENSSHIFIDTVRNIGYRLRVVT